MSGPFVESHYRRELLAAALAYVERGWPVIPLKPITVSTDGRKVVRPTIEWVTSGPLTTVADVRRWFSPAGPARAGALAIANGPAGVHALDLDTYKAGAVAIDAPPGAWTQHTARGGSHIFTANPSGARNTTARMVGVDSRGEGGLTIMAPSVVQLADGTVAAYAADRPLSDLPRPDQLPPTPQAISDALGASTTEDKAAALTPGSGFFAPAATTRSQAMATMTAKLADIERAGHEGGARMAVMSAALYAGGLLHAGWFSAHEAADAIRGACSRVWGQPNDEDERWIEQGLADGERKPIATRADPLADGLAKPGKERAGGLASRIYTEDELEQLPPPEPLIEGWIDQGEFALITGPGGSGKSFTVLDMVGCVSIGQPWHGVPTKQARVLYVAGEGGRGVGSRIKAWCRANQVERSGIDVLNGPVDIYGTTEPENLRELADVILAEGYGVVVFDTYATCTPGLDENSATDTKAVTRNIEALRSLGPSIIVVHHTAKEGTSARGSGALPWASQHGIAVAKNDKTGLVTVTNDRQREHEDKQRKLFVLLADDATGSAYLKLSAEDVPFFSDNGTHGASELSAVDAYDTNAMVPEGEFDGRGQPGSTLDLMVTHVAQTIAQSPAGMTRADVIRSLKGMGNDRTIRRAWDTLYAAGALEPANGRVTTPHGLSHWVAPGPERTAILTQRVLKS